MLGGGGNFGARFCYSTNINQIQESLPLCTNCLKRMMCDPFFLQKINDCDVCVNWDMMANSELMKYKSPKTIYQHPIIHQRN